MADRSAAAIFAQIFELLASDLSKEQIAVALWRETKYYDFSEDQIGEDESLILLGLAHRNEDGSIHYKDYR